MKASSDDRPSSPGRPIRYRRRYTSSKSPRTARSLQNWSAMHHPPLSCPRWCGTSRWIYTALSLVATGEVHFRFKKEGQDRDWREVVNDRQVEYTEPRPGGLPLPRDGLQQQRGVERGGHIPGIFPSPRRTTRPLGSAVVRGRFFSHCSGRFINCDCIRWRGSSTCVWRAQSTNGHASAGNCMTLFYKTYHGFLFRFQAAGICSPGAQKRRWKL